MKYIKFTLLALFTLFRKIFGLVWYWAVVPFRKYARSVVQNYALQGNISLKRLAERHPVKIPMLEAWELQDVHNVGRKGIVHKRKVSAIEFWIVVFLLWGWVDDDTNNDTFDAGHLNRYLTGDLEGSIMTKLFRKQMQKAVDTATYGNTFDLGDLRADTPNFAFIPALIWNTRNTGYNFQYLLETTSNPDDVFLIDIFGAQIGWVPDGEVDGKKYWMMVTGF